jgi:hypothetical protein
MLREPGRATTVSRSGLGTTRTVAHRTGSRPGRGEFAGGETRHRVRRGTPEDAQVVPGDAQAARGFGRPTIKEVTRK